MEKQQSAWQLGFHEKKKKNNNNNKNSNKTWRILVKIVVIEN